MGNKETRIFTSGIPFLVKKYVGLSANSIKKKTLQYSETIAAKN